MKPKMYRQHPFEVSMLAAYMEDPEPESTSCPNPCGPDILRFWSATGVRRRFDLLSQLARHLLAVPAASTASERAFSASGRILEERRSRLAPESLDALMVLRKH